MRTRGVFLASAVTLSLVTGALWGALADDSAKGDDQGQRRGDEKLVLKKTLGVGSDASGKPLKLGAFDISFVDPKIELYILADRTNASVDLFDSEQAEFIGRVGAKCPTATLHQTGFLFPGVQGDDVHIRSRRRRNCGSQGDLGRRR